MKNKKNDTDEYGDSDVIRGLKTALSEILLMRSDQDTSMNGMREVAKTLFTSSTLIISAVGLFNFPDVISDGPNCVSIILLLALAIAYLVFVCFTWAAIKPVGWTTAFKEDYESLTKSLCKEEALMVAQQITGHLNALNKNREEMDKRRKWLERAGFLMILIIALLLILVVVS